MRMWSWVEMEPDLDARWKLNQGNKAVVSALGMLDQLSWGSDTAWTAMRDVGQLPAQIGQWEQIVQDRRPAQIARYFYIQL